MWTTPDDPLREDPEYGGHNIILNRRFDVASRIEHWCLSFGDTIADDLWEEYGRVYPGSCAYY